MTNELSNEPATRQVAASGNLVTVKSVQRPVAERPLHDTIDGIAEWLIGQARRNPSFTETFDELAWRLLAAGMPAATREPA